MKRLEGSPPPRHTWPLSRQAEDRRPRRPHPTDGARTAKPGTKNAIVLELLGRPEGVTLTDIMTATGWQAHSVRGFVSTAAKKYGVTIESVRNDAKERVYTAR